MRAELEGYGIKGGQSERGMELKGDRVRGGGVRGVWN